MDASPQNPLTSYSCTLDARRMEDLREILRARSFAFSAPPHAVFAAARGDVSVAAYRSGKVLIQGKGTRGFVEFILEPEILKEARLGYEHLLEKFEGERIGVDESGKGDYFGPLVVAGVYLNEEQEKKLRGLGVRDSKTLSDRRAIELRRVIRRDCLSSVVAIGPERYNQLYSTMGNLNLLLAWGHARVIENLLSKVSCSKAVLDQFGHKDLVLRALMKKGKNIEVIQQFRGESDMAVAAASVLARGEFLLRLKKLSEELGVALPKGNAIDLVLAAGRAVIGKWGMESLVRAAKVHFKTTKEMVSN
jgi:ribonuclease HIII